MYSISSFVAVHSVTRSDGWMVYGISLGGYKLTRFYFSTFLKCYLNMSLSCYSGILRSLAINTIVRIGRSNSSFFYLKVSLPYLRNSAFRSRNCLSCFEANFIRILNWRNVHYYDQLNKMKSQLLLVIIECKSPTIFVKKSPENIRDPSNLLQKTDKKAGL